MKNTIYHFASPVDGHDHISTVVVTECKGTKTQSVFFVRPNGTQYFSPVQLPEDFLQGAYKVETTEL